MMNTLIIKTIKSNNHSGLLLAFLSSVIISSSCSINWLDIELNRLSGSVQTFGRYLDCVGTLDGVLVDEDTWAGLDSAPLTMCIQKESNTEISLRISVYTGRSLYCFPKNDSYWELLTSSFKLKGSPKDVSFNTSVPLSIRPVHSTEVYSTMNADIKGWLKSAVVQTKTQPSLDKYTGDIIISWTEPDKEGAQHELHIYEFSERLYHK